MNIVKPAANPYYVPGQGLDPEVITYMRAYIVARAKAVGPNPDFANEAALRAFEAEHKDTAEGFRLGIVAKHAPKEGA